MAPNLKTIAKGMAKFAADIGKVKVVAGSEHPNGVFRFYVELPEALPQDTVVSLCRSWAQIVRKALPDRQDNWSSAIEVITPLDMEVGVYSVGWP